jgi:hypothetical protein
MTPTTRIRRLGAALLLPVVLLLAGCGKLTADFDIKDENSYDIDLDFALDKSIAQDQLMISSPDEFCGELDSESSEFTDSQLESYEKDDMWGCKVSGTVPKSGFGDGFDITKQDDQLHLSIEGDSSFDTSEYDSIPGAGDFEFSMTFTFPGKVTSSTVGEVKGKTVTLSSPNDLAGGVDIYAKDSGSAVGIIIAVVIVLLVLVVLAVAAVVIILVVRNKKKNTPPPPAPFGAAPGAPGAPGMPGAPGNAGPYGAPTSGAPAGDPNQPQPYPGAPAGQQPGQPQGQDAFGQHQPLAPDTPQWNPAPQPGQSAPSPQAPGGQQQWGQQPPQWGQQSPQQPGSPQQPPQAPPWGQQPPQAPPAGSPQEQQWGQQPGAQQSPQAPPWGQQPPQPGSPQDPRNGQQ